MSGELLVGVGNIPPPTFKLVPEPGVVFSDWLLSLSNMHLRFFHVFSWLDSSFLISFE